MTRLLSTLFLLLLPATLLRAQSEGETYPIIITTPGYTSIHHYTSADIAERLPSEFHLSGDVALNEDSLGDDSRRVYLTIGLKQFDFLLTPQMPVVRLMFDRNRRLFSGTGCNFIDREGASYTPPRFKETELTELPAQWAAEINRQIQDRTLLGDEPAVFLLELDIDENGIVHKITELGGGLKQYSRPLIDFLYDKAVRGWTPARCNGVPVRALAQLRIELKR